eukprot:CAMPEP_0202378346 /NCGR_PEP_ID=MMETSP1127-20130417/17620_1 /ASSEMBLY_ACC=CAM_ASM_000462 /TAXON_ID=3047 /ORGANISM="Dunaliella tertiolecta, Strain CCMP1320" /LENGTH=261 /DNA_ID=CAMNT_0048976617 /DNA_START=389 /DNA_END=1175 /DNA_ORIENTATION=-
MQLDRPACPSMAAYVHPWRLVSVHGWLMPIHGSLSPSGLPFLLARLLPCSWAGWLLEHTRRLGHLQGGGLVLCTELWREVSFAVHFGRLSILQPARSSVVRVNVRRPAGAARVSTPHPGVAGVGDSWLGLELLAQLAALCCRPCKVAQPPLDSIPVVVCVLLRVAGCWDRLIPNLKHLRVWEGNFSLGDGWHMCRGCSSYSKGPLQAEGSARATYDGLADNALAPTYAFHTSPRPHHTAPSTTAMTTSTKGMKLTGACSTT